MEIMVMLLAYFELVSVLLGIYAFFRLVIWLEFRKDFAPALPSADSNIESHPIDTTPPAHRLEDIRRDYAAEAHLHPSAAHKPELVEERHAEIAKLAFFQKPPSEPEPHDPEPGVVLMAL